VASGACSLLKLGWRPRRSFSLSSLRDSYIPGIVFYLNLYYITGISKALEPFACTKTAVGSYLNAAPSITCWEGEHLEIIGLDTIPILIYVIGVPLLYAVILFKMVPQHGFRDKRLQATFGFIWSRFESEVYWWEAVEFTGRKLPLVLISLFIDDNVIKCVLGAVCVGGVMAGNFKHAPYIKSFYDILDQVVSSGEAVLFLFGLLVTYRQKTRELEATGANIVVFDEAGTIDSLVIVAIVLILCILAVGAYLDAVWLKEQRNKRLVRKEKAIGEPKYFDMNAQGGVLFEWLRQAKDEDLQRFFRVQLMLDKVKTRQGHSKQGHTKEKVAVYEAQNKSLPFIFDRILGAAQGDVFLSQFVGDYATSTLTCSGFEFGSLLFESFAPTVLMWLNESASPTERVVIQEFVDNVKAFEKTFSPSPTFLESAFETVSGYCKPSKLAEVAKDVEHSVASAAKATAEKASLFTSKQEQGGEKKTLNAVFRRNSTLLEGAKRKLLQSNEVQQLLTELLDETNAEGIAIVPVAPLADGQQLPKMVIGSTLYGDDPEKDQAKLERVIDWECTAGSPAGLAKESRKLVNVTNIITDSRFPKQNFQSLGRDAISGLSRLVVPIFEGGGAASDAEDDSIGSTLIGLVCIFNKVSFDGMNSGVAFEKRDEIAASVYNTLIVETMNRKEGTRKTSFLDKLQAAKATEKARNTLEEAAQAQKSGRKSFIDAVAASATSSTADEVVPVSVESKV